MGKKANRPFFFGSIWRVLPPVARATNEMLAAEERAEAAEWAKAAAPAERVWWAEAADGRRWRL